jgi:hypothetical protein
MPSTPGDITLAVGDGARRMTFIKSVTFYVGRKSVRDADEAGEYAKLSADELGYTELEPDDTLAVGEKV